MKRRYVFLPLLLATAAHAEMHASFTHFAVGKEGAWQSTTTMLDGPQKGKVIESSTCFTAAQAKAGANAMIASSAAMKNCKTTVTGDTAEAASSDQVCNFGPVTTHLTTQMKKVDADTFETTITNSTGGMTTHTRTVSHYVGACTAPATEKGATTSECSQCNANAAKMKDSCAGQPAPQKAACMTMIPQMEAACKMSCP